MIFKIFLPFYFTFSVFNILAQEVRLTTKFDSSLTPRKPDYSLNTSWAALPFMKDYADTAVGTGNYKDEQSTASADVFFIYATSFTYKPEGPNKWNGDIADKKLKKITDEGGIRYQASIFNGTGKIYAPYYRQAHYYSYFTLDTASSGQAFDVAYQDVKSAFEFYLKNYNNGRPIILASHSQGTTHALKLLKEFFDGKDLGNRLVCAYLTGMPVYDTLFQTIKPCKNEQETGCYCTWRTFAVGYYPKWYMQKARLSVCTNPLIWTIDSTYAPAKLNKGGVLFDLRTVIPGICDARIEDGVLRINKPHYKGSAFLRIKNYHVADYNLFYINVRENAALRTKVFLGK